MYVSTPSCSEVRPCQAPAIDPMTRWKNLTALFIRRFPKAGNMVSMNRFTTAFLEESCGLRGDGQVIAKVHQRAVQHYCVAGHGHGGFGAEATLNVTSSGQDAWGLWPPALSEPWWMVCLVCGAPKGPAGSRKTTGKEIHAFPRLPALRPDRVWPVP